MKLKLHKLFKRIVAKVQRPKAVKEVFGNPARRRAKLRNRATHRENVRLQQSVGMEWAWVRKAQRLAGCKTIEDRQKWCIANDKVFAVSGVA